jgi:hypothetical protein
VQSPGYIVEDTPRGESLVVTGPWSDEAARRLASGEVDALVLNYARGFCEGSLDLLDEGWPLRRLSILDRSIVDLEPIGRLRGLREICVRAAESATLDLALLPHLQTVNGEWALIGPTLSAVADLEHLSTWRFGERGLYAIRGHFALTTLKIKDAPWLESMSGIGGLSKLASLVIVGAPRLSDISDLAGLSSSLTELTLEECAQIDEIDAVEPLTELRFLSISEAGDIASLAPVASLLRLETFYGWGSTRVVDNDLTPLADLPHLKEVRIRPRRGYTPSARDLPAAVF